MMIRTLSVRVFTQSVVGRERRERVSQLAWCGEGCFDSRRRVNSTVMLLSKLKIACAVIVLLCLSPTITVSKPSERAHVLALCDQLYGRMIDRRMGLYAV